MVLTAVLPLLATLQGPGDCAPEARVFVLAGQSNMAGLYAFEELLPPGLAAPQADVALWDGGASAPGWKPLAPGSGVDFGPELSLGRALADASPEDQVFLIKYAQGSTALHDDWAPPAGPEWLGLQATVASALGELTQAGIPFELGGMFWMQGEGDAVDGMGAAYEANLRAFVDQVRLDLASPDLPFVLGRILEGWGDPFNDQAVRAAQVAVGTTTPWATWVDTDDLSALGGHYDADGQVHLGERFAAAWHGLFGVGAWTDLGQGHAASGAAPLLVGDGLLWPCAPTALRLDGAPPGTPGLLAFGSGSAPTPFLGGVLVPDPTAAGGWLPFVTDALGRAAFQQPWPGGLPAGASLVFQAWLADAIPGTYLASNAVQALAP